MRQWALLAGLVAVGCAAVSGPSVIGSGVAATEDRDAAGFTGISASTGLSVTVTAGGEDAVEVTADDNVLPLVVTQVDGETLKVHLSGSVRTSTPIKVAVTAKKLTGVSASAGASVTADKVFADAWTAEVSSGATVTARGVAGEQTVSASSGGSFDGTELVGKTVTANASSGGSAAVHATGSLKATASSGGSVRYRGGPKEVDAGGSSGGTVGEDK